MMYITKDQIAKLVEIRFLQQGYSLSQKALIGFCKKVADDIIDTDKILGELLEKITQST